jgi:hypothetical protein
MGKTGNLKFQSVKEVYFSSEFDTARQKSLACDYPCMLGCYIRPGIFELIRIGLNNLKVTEL